MKNTAIYGLLPIAALIPTMLFAAGTPNNQGSPGSATMPVTTPNRSVYLNGVDISSSRNEDLRNVHIKISENGDLFISAPQYQVTEEETFMPLSSYTTKSMPPEHKPPQPMRGPDQPSSGKINDSVTPQVSNPTKPDSEKTASRSAPAQPQSKGPPKSGG